jgi:WG containing repeat
MRETSIWLGLLLLCLVNAVASVVQAQPAKSEPQKYLYQIDDRDPRTGKKRIGFIDQTGKVVIGFDRLPKTTIAVGEFHEGRALIYLRKIVRDESREYPDSVTAYIDESGEVVIAAAFDVAKDFSEGLAYVEVEAEGFKGFIDRMGQRVITLVGKKAKDFHEGLAAAQGEGNKWGYINRSGKWIVKPQYEFADDFSEGLAGVVINGKYGFINNQGELVIPARFDVRRELRHPELLIGAGRFKEGLASVAVDRSYGYINKQGTFVVQPRFFTAQEFSEGLAFVVEMSEINKVVNKAGWIDKSGRYVITGVEGQISSDDFARTFSDPNGLLDWGFAEGLARFGVYRGSSYLLGYIDRQGKVAIEPKQYNRTDRFRGGIAWVEIRDFGMDQDYGYIDRQGRFIWHSKR